MAGAATGTVVMIGCLIAINDFTGKIFQVFANLPIPDFNPYSDLVKILAFMLLFTIPFGVPVALMLDPKKELSFVKDTAGVILMTVPATLIVLLLLILTGGMLNAGGH